MAYTTINKSTDHFNTKLYAGNGSTQSISGVGFQPDWVWIKDRDNSSRWHQLFDAVRGAGKVLYSNDGAQQGDDNTRLSGFASDGFSLGNSANVNNNGNNYVAWNWKANGAGSSNSDGDITSTVSANTTSGFSIVKWTSNGSNNDTIGHGLGVAPKIVLYKRLDGTNSWTWTYKYVDGTLDFLILDGNNAKQDLTLGTYGFTTSTTISNLGFGNTNEMIAYCFVQKKGYSDFGTYTGNGNADGTFVYTGFKPAWVMTKRTDSTSSWIIRDNKRDAFNPSQTSLYANAATADDTSGGASYYIDFLSNGFKFTGNGTGFNASGGTYIYMAFAAAPLVGSNNVPATAR
jgi:hypothetical protein|tara:strand:- start:42 stop:1076 length:1035 start_codon:yes stop_codon:yes gene_type:complete